MSVKISQQRPARKGAAVSQPSPNGFKLLGTANSFKVLILAPGCMRGEAGMMQVKLTGLTHGPAEWFFTRGCEPIRCDKSEGMEMGALMHASQLFELL